MARRLTGEEKDELELFKDEVKSFDMDSSYGPYTHISRNDRAARAEKFGVGDQEKLQWVKAMLRGEFASTEEVAKRMREHGQEVPSDAPRTSYK